MLLPVACVGGDSAIDHITGLAVAAFWTKCDLAVFEEAVHREWRNSDQASRRRFRNIRLQHFTLAAGQRSSKVRTATLRCNASAKILGQALSRRRTFALNLERVWASAPDIFSRCESESGTTCLRRRPYGNALN